MSSQTFTPGTAPVAGYEGKTFLRVVTSGQTLSSAYTFVQQAIEDVRSYAGQTVTLSFWAKAATGTPKIAPFFQQDFGTGGSPSTAVTTLPAANTTISTSWARYTTTITLPSLSGKTIGTNANSSFLLLRFWISVGSDRNAECNSLGIQSNTFDIWGVQLEAGSAATAFQTATGSIQGELAACQRYYWRATAGSAFQSFASGQAKASTSAFYTLTNPVFMRVFPSSLEYSTLGLLNGAGSVAGSVTALSLSYPGTQASLIEATVASGLTAGQGSQLVANNSTSAYIGVNAEL
jgi:hypothetical protein